MTMSNRPNLLFSLAALLCFGVNDSFAQQIEDGGLLAFTPKSSESFEVANGNTITRSGLAVVVFSDDPDSPFHMASQDCAMTSVTSKDGNVLSSKGYCDGVDAEGDVWYLHLDTNSDGNAVWTIVSGTGKFSNASGGGVTTNGPAWGDGKSVGMWKGSYSMD
jgi:hypothetical protein